MYIYIYSLLMPIVPSLLPTAHASTETDPGASPPKARSQELSSIQRWNVLPSRHHSPATTRPGRLLEFHNSPSEKYEATNKHDKPWALTNKKVRIPTRRRNDTQLGVGSKKDPTLVSIQ